mgnify:CR=1 FL=1
MSSSTTDFTERELCGKTLEMDGNTISQCKIFIIKILDSLAEILVIFFE